MAVLREDQYDRLADVVTAIVQEGADRRLVVDTLIDLAAIYANTVTDDDPCKGGIVLCRSCFVTAAREAHNTALKEAERIKRAH
jgi:hypothetical protein